MSLQKHMKNISIKSNETVSNIFNRLDSTTEKTMKKSITIDVKVYFTRSGVPTCASSVGNGSICMFLRATAFGTKEVCVLTNDRIYESEEEYLIPSDRCILHKKEE